MLLCISFSFCISRVLYVLPIPCLDLNTQTCRVFVTGLRLPRFQACSSTLDQPKEHFCFSVFHAPNLIQVLLLRAVHTLSSFSIHEYRLARLQNHYDVVAYCKIPLSRRQCSTALWQRLPSDIFVGAEPENISGLLQNPASADLYGRSGTKGTV